MPKRLPKTKCGGKWTEGQFNSFIKSMLRKGSMRWGPRNEAKKDARWYKKLPNDKGRMVFHSVCANCLSIVPETTTAADHIAPVIPITGRGSWDETIERMFCEKEGFQILCTPCHTVITQKEKEERRKYAARIT